MNIFIKIVGKLIIPILAVISFLYVGLYNEDYHYKYLFCMPLFYFFISIFFLLPQLSLKSSIFYIVLNVIFFFRYVVLPFMTVFSEFYYGRSPVLPQISSFNLSFFLIVYELFIAGIVASWCEKKYQKHQSYHQILKMKLGSNKNLIFILFSIFTILYLLLNRNWLAGVNFFKANRIEAAFDENVMISSYLFLILKQILFVFFVYSCSVNYKKTNRKIYLLFSIIILFVNMGIFFGTNRSDVLITTIVSALLLADLFPLKVIKYSMLFILLSVSVLISQITDTRQLKSISNNENQLVDGTDFLQSYLGGPYNVAIAVETKETFPEVSRPEVLFFDIARPMIGINFLVKNMNLKYSNVYFNQRMFMTEQRSQILPMIGQGYIFFGEVFAPIFSILVIILAYYFMGFSRNYSNPLLSYFFLLSIVRMAFFVGQNTMNIINDISFNLFLFLIIFYLNKKFHF